jgi:hypothetical protein
MDTMVLVLNAVLYVVALGLSLAVLTPIPARAPRRLRVARRILVVGGGVMMSAAIALSFRGDWFLSGLAGSVSLIIVSACMWVALTARAAPGGDDEEDDGGGGGPRKRPEPPAPTEPAGGPSDELWTEFDRARAGWEPEREPTPA